MVHAGESELRQAFYAHLRVAVANRDQSHYLLLFYAAECGLKWIYLKQRRFRTTERIVDQSLISERGHDLIIWLKELRAPAAIVGQIVHFRLQKDHSVRDITSAHQAWRYGVRILSEDEERVIAWLESLCRWIKEHDWK